MLRIVDVHYPDLQRKLVNEALNLFYEIREVPGMKKKPSTSELLDWIKLLMVDDITRCCSNFDDKISSCNSGHAAVDGLSD